MSSNAIVSGGHPDAALSMPAAVVSTGNGVHKRHLLTCSVKLWYN